MYIIAVIFAVFIKHEVPLVKILSAVATCGLEAGWRTGSRLYAHIQEHNVQITEGDSAQDSAAFPFLQEDQQQFDLREQS